MQVSLEVPGPPMKRIREEVAIFRMKDKLAQTRDGEPLYSQAPFSTQWSRLVARSVANVIAAITTFYTKVGTIQQSVPGQIKCLHAKLILHPQPKEMQH